MSVKKPVKDGYYRTELNKSDWEVPNRYQKLNLIGYGAFGQVCSAIDTVTERKVAIKKLSRPFQSGVHAKRTYRELRLLKHMQHDNVIGLVDLFTPAEIFEEFDELYLVTVLMGGDLNKLIKQHKLSEDHIQFFIYQVLRALKYIHSAGIIHRDLKPGNIAVNEDLELRILDFGLARQTDDQMTGYVATRWYRAPEVMLNWTHYNQTMDMWSVGCIMAEMLMRKPLFPGGDHIDQLTHILSLVGTPNDQLLDKIDSQDAREYVKQLPKWTKKSFKEVFKGVNPQAIDLLERMLDLDGDTRITAEEALAHPYMSKYADPSDEPTAPKFDDSFESTNYSVLELRKLVFDEAMSFKPADSESMEN